MRLGIFARTFPRATLGETFDAVAATGLETMQFNMALTGGPSMPDTIPAELAARVATAAADRALGIAAVSGTYNMAHPDTTVRDDGLRRLGVLLAAAAMLGTRIVTLCTGSRDSTDMWRRHPDNTTPAAWRAMLASVEAAVTLAETHDVTLAFEPEHTNVVDSAAAGRHLLDDIASPHLRVVIDPANLIDARGLGRQADTLRAAFELLGDDIVLAHAKDVTRGGAIVAAGRGDLDYELYLALLAQTGRPVPLILHGLDEDEVPASIAFVRTAEGRAVTAP